MKPSENIRTQEKKLKKLQTGSKSNLSPNWFASYDETSGFPVRTGNRITPLYDGKTIFETLHEDLLWGAKESVHIAIWSFMPGMRLIREPTSDGLNKSLIDSESLTTIGGVLEHLLYKNKTIKIKLLVWAVDLPLVEKKTLVELNRYGKDFTESIGLHGIPNPYYRNDINWWDKVLSGDYKYKDRFEVRFQSGKSIKTSLHQKNVIIDSKISFCMGCNFRTADWDSQEDLVINPLRDPGLGPRHDMAAKIEGPLVRDYEVNFAERWLHAGTGDGPPKYVTVQDPFSDLNPHSFPGVFPILDNGVRSRTVPTATPSDIRFLEEMKGLSIAPIRSKLKSYAQAVRTIDFSTFSDYTVKEQKIRETYLNAIINAQHYIYIEDQYFRYDDIRDAIIKRINETKGRIEVLIVVAVPGIGGKWFTIDDFKLVKKAFEIYGKSFTPYVLCADNSSHEIRIQLLDHMKKRHARFADLLEGVNELFGEESSEYLHLEKYPHYRVRMSNDFEKALYQKLNSGGYDSVRKQHYRPVSSHIKIMIIDDTYVTIGSANINERAMEYDAEFNVAIVDYELASNLRLNLWSRDVGWGMEFKHDYILKNQTPIIILKQIKQLKKSAIENKKRLNQGKPLKGKLMPLSVFLKQGVFEKIMHFYLKNIYRYTIPYRTVRKLVKNSSSNNTRVT